MTPPEMNAQTIRQWLVDPEQAARFDEAYHGALEALECMDCMVIDPPDRVDYLARLVAAVSPQHSVVLFNPQWGAAERKAAEALIEEHLDDMPAGHFYIPTGGTGGRVKFAIHTRETFSAAVEGYARFWGRERLNAVCPLPVCHIGGLMLAQRTLLTGGQLWLADPKLEQTPPPGFDFSAAHVSLVGAQLRRALDNGVGWLRECEAVLVGGGPAQRDLINDALAAGLPLYTAYGLTEAAATVALARAEEDPALGQILPHWEASIGGDGQIQLDGPAVFKGYLGQPPRADGPWPTGDRGELVGGQLRVHGRMGRVIITGGKKVDAALLEERLSEWPEVSEAMVFSEPDPTWGEAVCAVVATPLSAEKLTPIARERLMPEMRPKRWAALPEIPRLPNGKPDWAAIRTSLRE